MRAVATDPGLSNHAGWDNEALGTDIAVVTFFTPAFA